MDYFIRNHGAYIYDLRIGGTQIFRCEMKINANIAYEMYKAVEPDSEVEISEFNSRFINKEYRIVQQRYDSVFAIYKHDSSWWLCKAKKSEFIQAYTRLYGSKRLKSLNIPQEL